LNPLDSEGGEEGVYSARGGAILGRSSSTYWDSHSGRMKVKSGEGRGGALSRYKIFEEGGCASVDGKVPPEGRCQKKRGKQCAPPRRFCKGGKKVIS